MKEDRISRQREIEGRRARLAVNEQWKCGSRTDERKRSRRIVNAKYSGL